MKKSELKERMVENKKRLNKLKEIYYIFRKLPIEIYYISIGSFLNYGFNINSKDIRKNGQHLVSLSNEMRMLEEEIEILKNTINEESSLNMKYAL